MADLRLDVRLDGFEDPSGMLTRDENGALTFVYTAQHLSLAGAMPVSLALPLTDEPYQEPKARAFFRNLLQEQDRALEHIRARENIAADDVAGLLLHLGKDCPGALSVVAEGADPVKVPGDFETDYEPISDQKLSEILTSLKERGRLPANTNDPSPLAGVQSKVALTLLPDETFASPKANSGAPTTHILKVQGENRYTAPKLEGATLNLAKACGLTTVEARVKAIGELDVLVVSRFDRFIGEDGKIYRVHQEDFAQALGLPPELKYERNANSRDRRFDLTAIRSVLDATRNPAKARDTFIALTLFDLLTGNVDGHAKNHAILHLGAGHIELAPRYDLNPTGLDDDLTDELAYNIGSARSLAEITAADLAVFLQALGVQSMRAQNRVLKRHLEVISATLARSLEPLTQNGMKNFADLIAQNMRQLLPVAGLDVPEQAANRDAFIVRAGGWTTS